LLKNKDFSSLEQVFFRLSFLLPELALFMFFKRRFRFAQRKNARFFVSTRIDIALSRTKLQTNN